jgi:hypothetical protein
MTLCDSIKLIKFGLAKETTQGTPEDSPDEYAYLVNDETIKFNRAFDELNPASSRDLVLSTGLGYTTAISPQIWALPVANCLGHFLTGAMGKDTSSQQGTTTAYKHTISLEDCLPSYTVWTKSGIFERKSTNNKINTLTINSPQNKTVSVTANFLGGRAVASTDFGDPTYTTLNPFKSSMGTITFGQSGAAVQSNITEFNLTIDNGIQIDEGIVHGQYYPYNVQSGDRVISGDLSFWMEDDDEAMRFFEGVNTDPTATEIEENPGMVSLNVKFIGPEIVSPYNYELELDMDSVVLSTFEYTTSGTRIGGRTSFRAVKGTATNLLVAYLTNTASSDY